jgi:hypothetical protein
MKVLPNRILTVCGLAAAIAAVVILQNSGILVHQDASIARLLASVVWGS